MEIIAGSAPIGHALHRAVVASVAVGHGLASAFDALRACWPHHRYFAMVAAVALLAAAVLLQGLRSLKTIIIGKVAPMATRDQQSKKSK